MRSLAGSPARYRAALEAAGFAGVRLFNRNPWYAEVGAAELADLSGPARAGYEQRHGADFIANQIATWQAMVAVLQSGEHCPYHLRGQKPG